MFESMTNETQNNDSEQISSRDSIFDKHSYTVILQALVAILHTDYDTQQSEWQTTETWAMLQFWPEPRKLPLDSQQI